MSKEDQILEMLNGMQSEIKIMRAEIEELKPKTKQENSSKNYNNDNMEVIRKMSKILTKEEADNLAAAVVTNRKRMYI